ncbi:MAG: HEAT repeat domain-containing protein [Bacteriovoracaceae bacterium]|nr:HEAT repeat domain-containing protein [Bacteriovoracaceae bacterium]
MKGRLLPTFFKSDFSSYMLCFFQGQSIYFLKLISIVQLVNTLSLKAFPYLMLLQAIIAYISIQLSHKLVTSSKLKFHIITSALSILVLAINYNLGHSPEDLTFPLFIFILSSNLTTLSEISYEGEISQRISVLKNPKISTYLTFAKEVGVMAAAGMMLFFEKFFSQETQMIVYLPFILSSAFVVVSYFIQPASAKNKVNIEAQKTPFDKFHFPFINMIIVLIGIMFLIKNLQSFGVLLAMNLLKDNAEYSTSTIYSYLSIVETVCIISMLSFTALMQKKAHSWSRGFNLYFIQQFTGMASLVFTMNPFLFLGAGVLRKVSQRTFIESAITLLMSSFPQRVAVEARIYVKKFVGLYSYVFLALITYPLTQGMIGQEVFWALGSGISLLGLFFRKKLFNQVTEYLVANIVRSNIYDAYNACLALAHPEAKNHSTALLSLLKSNPRPFLAKAIIHALGEISDPRSLPYLMKYFHESKREDMQLTVVQALLKFKTHEVDLFLVQTLRRIIIEQVSLGQIRRSIFRAITSRINDIAIPSLLEIVQGQKNDQRIVANALFVLGEIARETRDPGLYKILSQYLSDQYTRRVVTNVIVFLFDHPRYKQLALEHFEVYLTSNDPNDRAAVAFLAGELKMSSLIPYVYENSKQVGHKNSTLLISLLKQKYPESYSLVANYILSSESNESRETCLNQLSAINQQQLRYKVYFHILDNHPNEIPKLLEYLRNSERDFDEDRRLIQQEAIRLGIEVEDDNQLFVEAEQVTKTPERIKKSA